MGHIHLSFLSFPFTTHSLSQSCLLPPLLSAWPPWQLSSLLLPRISTTSLPLALTAASPAPATTVRVARTSTTNLTSTTTCRASTLTPLLASRSPLPAGPVLSPSTASLTVLLCLSTALPTTSTTTSKAALTPALTLSALPSANEPTVVAPSCWTPLDAPGTTPTLTSSTPLRDKKRS